MTYLHVDEVRGCICEVRFWILGIEFGSSTADFARFWFAGLRGFYCDSRVGNTDLESVSDSGTAAGTSCTVSVEILKNCLLKKKN